MSYPPGKPPDLDEYGNPESNTGSNKPPDLDEQGNPVEEQSFLNKAWHTISDPLITAPARWGASLEESLTDPNQQIMHPTGQGGLHDYLAERLQMGRGFIGGAAKGVGEVISGLSSPLNIAATLLPGGAEYAAAKQMPGVSRALSLAGRGMGGLMAAHGAGTTFSPDENVGLPDRLMGLTEMAGGAAGMMHSPGLPVRPEMREVPPSISPEMLMDTPMGREGKGPYFEKNQAMEAAFKASQQPPRASERFPGDEAYDLGEIGLPPEVRQDQIPQPVPPEFHPVGGEEMAPPEPSNTPGLSEEDFYNIAREKFGMGLPQSPETPEISGARTDTGGVKIGADVKSLGKILGSSLYSGDIKTIATKELLQNSIDAIRSKDAEGHIKVHFDENEHTLTVEDNGKGLTPDEIRTIFTDLGSSGKRGEDAAIGGFGLAKAAPLLGGEFVEVHSVAQDPATGNYFRTHFEGSPDELLEGVNLNVEEIPAGNVPVSTGTKVRVWTPKEGAGSFYDAKNFVHRIAENSEFPGTIETSRTYGKNEKPVYAKVNQPTNLHEFHTIDTPTARVRLLKPTQARVGETSSMEVMYRNKGMYQHTNPIYFNDTVSGVPDKVLVDIDSKVPEGHPEYPFTANREDVRGTIKKDVEDYIKEHIVSPATKERVAGIQQLYDSMPSVKSGRSSVFFHDVGSKYTPEELNFTMGSPTMKVLGSQAQEIARMAAGTLGPDMVQKLDRVGFIFSEKLRGIHIPNPSGGQSAVMVNPLQLMLNRTPDEAAAGFVHTLLHEVAHMKVGRHNEDFTIHLGDVYEKYGAENAVSAQKLFKKAVAATGGREYTPQVQELLQRYSESRGRGVTQDDALTRTGIGSGVTDKGQGKVPGSGGPDGEGTVNIKNTDKAPLQIKRLLEQGYEVSGIDNDGNFVLKPGIKMGAGGKPPKPPILEEEVGHGKHRVPKEEEKNSIPAELSAFTRTMMATWDMSAPFRQGLGLVHKAEFWKAIPTMVKAWGSEAAYKAAMDDIVNNPRTGALFKKRVGAGGKVLDSFAEEMGLKLTDLHGMSTREEAIMSQMAEKYVPGVRGSNRAYTIFLNKLRADTFASLIQDAKVFGVDGTKNLPLAKGLAEFVNTATGRGNLGMAENSAKLLSQFMFSPRLMASRLQMMNPRNYIMGPKAVRMEYLKSLLAIAGFGNTLGQLAKLGGGTVENNPGSSDFGKIKFGDTRIDPYGGFQQYIVAAKRLLPHIDKLKDMPPQPTDTGIVPLDNAMGMVGRQNGMMKSTTTGREYDLMNPKFGQSSQLDVASRFVQGKAAPIPNFIMGLLRGQKEMSGRSMNFTTLNPMENAIAQRFIPMVWQDLYDLARNENTPIGAKLLAAPLAATGMGVQTYGKQDFGRPSFQMGQ